MAERRESLPPLLKERWLLEEANAEERARLEGELSASQRNELRAQHERLSAELFARLPPERLRERVNAALQEERTAGKGRWLPYAATALCAALALIVFGPRAARDARSPVQEQEMVERAKGLVPTLNVYRRRGDVAEQLSPGAVLSPHDVLQLGYVAAGYTHAVLLSIDGRGEVTLHAPRHESAATRLRPLQGEHLLDEAYELDDAPSFERFFLVVSRAPLDVAQLMERARELVKEGVAERELLSVPTGTRQFAVTFRKGPP